MSKRLNSIIALLVILISLAAGCAPAAATSPTTAVEPGASTASQPTATTRASTPGRLILATTTSTQDSGLLDSLLPDFEAEFNTDVDVIAVGTGQALQIGRDGNADVLMVHARSQEDAFMAAGDGVRREDVMYNDFVIVGPAADPAQIKGMTSVAEAFQKLSEAGAAGTATFISRGDNSGTHAKELSIWKSAGIEPSGAWYVSAGQGMGEVLTMTAEQAAYTLSDRATYLARTKSGLALEVVVEKGQSLLNPYGLIAVNPSKGPQINAELANQFIDWMISLPVQEKIAQFGVDEYGESLFVPDSAAWRAK